MKALSMDLRERVVAFAKQGANKVEATRRSVYRKVIRYRERNEAQRWLYRRKLEKLWARTVYYLDECGIDHRLHREKG